MGSRNIQIVPWLQHVRVIHVFFEYTSELAGQDYQVREAREAIRYCREHDKINPPTTPNKASIERLQRMPPHQLVGIQFLE